MCDFHNRLVAEVGKLDGIARVCLSPRGKHGARRRFRRHPHLAVTLTTGNAFDFPVRGRPIDGCAGYFKSILGEIRRQVRKHLGEVPKPKTIDQPERKRRKVRRWVPPPMPGDFVELVPPIRYCGPPVSAAHGPFAVLARLAVEQAVAGSVMSEPNDLEDQIPEDFNDA